MTPRCVNYRSAQSIRERIHDSETSRRDRCLLYFLERLFARQCPPMNDSRPGCWIHRWWGRWRDWTSSTFNIYVSSDEPGLFPSLCNCSSHRRVLLLLLFFPLLLRLPLRTSRLTTTTVINWWAPCVAARCLLTSLLPFPFSSRESADFRQLDSPPAPPAAMTTTTVITGFFVLFSGFGLSSGWRVHPPT